MQVTPEAKKKSLEAKARGEDAFKRKDYQMAVDAYTQVAPLAIYSSCTLTCSNGSSVLFELLKVRVIDINLCSH